MEKNKVCTKRGLTKNEAKKQLKIILANNGKNPWRDEISTYLCEICCEYHLSSITDGGYTPLKVKQKSYFELQKEKWGIFLQKYSKNKGVINKRNKKYGT